MRRNLIVVKFRLALRMTRRRDGCRGIFIKLSRAADVIPLPGEMSRSDKRVWATPYPPLRPYQFLLSDEIPPSAILRQWVILSEVEPVGRRSMRRNLIVVKFRQAQDDPSERRMRPTTLLIYIYQDFWDDGLIDF